MVGFFVFLPSLDVLKRSIKVLRNIILDGVLGFRERRSADHRRPLIASTWFHILHILPYEINKTIDEFGRNLKCVSKSSSKL